MASCVAAGAGGSIGAPPTGDRAPRHELVSAVPSALGATCRAEVSRGT
jgi:hypothetical protein